MIHTEKQYNAMCERIEELLPLVTNDTPIDDKNFIELQLIPELVANHEEVKYPVEKPSLTESLS